MKNHLRLKIIKQNNFKIYFCKFIRLKNKVKNNKKGILKLKNRIIFFLFFFQLNFKTFSLKFENNKTLNVISNFILFFSELKSFNFLYSNLNDFFFFMHNSNSTFINFLLLNKKTPQESSLTRLLNFRNHTKSANFSFELTPFFKKTKIVAIFKLKGLIFLAKYFFFGKRYNWTISSKFKNNLVNFLLRSKKRVGVNIYQSVQDSAGYTNDEFLFTNNYFFKPKSIKIPKVGAYSTSRRVDNSIYKIPARTPVRPRMVDSPNFFLNKKFVNLNALNLTLNFFFKPIIFKYFYIFFKQSTKNFFSSKFLFNMAPRYFFLMKEKISTSNVFPTDDFSFYIKRYFLYITNFNKFNYQLILPFQISIIKFMQFCTGKKILFKVYPYLYNVLTSEEQIRCSLWSQKIKYYRKVLGPKLFLKESLQIIYLCLKHKDIHLFSNWTTAMFYKISFWKYKTFLRYLKYVLRYFFLGIYRKIEFKGIKFQLKGKISVAGNSRTRTSYHYVGFTSHSTFNNKILHKLNLVRTFTGVLGFKIWFVF